MRAIIASVLATALMADCAHADKTISASAVVEMFEQRDLKRVQRTSLKAVGWLPLEERNEAALAAAKSLSIKKYTGAIGKNSIHKHFTKPPGQDSPAEAECRRQWGINMSAAELLRHLSEQRMINDPRVLPYLIAALDHPDRGSVGQPCFYALRHLTYHESGDAYWAQLGGDAKRHVEVLSWWKEWWKKNRQKHPIFDRNVEERSRALVLDLAKRIDAELKPKYPQLAEFSVPKQLRLCGPPSPLFDIEYNPRLLANVHPHGLDRDDLPWLYIACELKTPDLTEPPGWRRQYERLPPRGLRSHLKKVYSFEVDGTDIIVSVRVASRQNELIKDIERVLKVADDQTLGLKGE